MAILTIDSYRKAKFVRRPEFFEIAPGDRRPLGISMICLDTGRILLINPKNPARWPGAKESDRRKLPYLYFSDNDGRSWKTKGEIKIDFEKDPIYFGNGGGSFLRLKDGRLMLALHQYNYTNKGGDLPIVSFSKDNGERWSRGRVVNGEVRPYYLLNNRLVQLSNDRLLMVVGMNTGEGVEGSQDVALAFFSDDLGETWKTSHKPATIDSFRGAQEPDVIETNDGGLLMLCRTGLGYHYMFESADRGETWSEGRPTTLQSACSSFTMERLPDGRLIVFYTASKPMEPGSLWPRSPICYAISVDEGRSWSEPVLIDDVGYTDNSRNILCPSPCFLKEGILLMYTVLPSRSLQKTAAGAHLGGAKICLMRYPENKDINTIPHVAGCCGSGN